MEPLDKHEQELNYRSNPQDGLEVQLVYNSLLAMAYTKVEDPRNNDKFTAIAPEGTSAVETFHHPYVYRIGKIPVRKTVGEEPLDGKGSE